MKKHFIWVLALNIFLSLGFIATPFAKAKDIKNMVVAPPKIEITNEVLRAGELFTARFGTFGLSDVLLKLKDESPLPSGLVFENETGDALITWVPTDDEVGTFEFILEGETVSGSIPVVSEFTVTVNPRPLVKNKSLDDFVVVSRVGGDIRITLNYEQLVSDPLVNTRTFNFSREPQNQVKLKLDATLLRVNRKDFQDKINRVQEFKLPGRKTGKAFEIAIVPGENSDQIDIASRATKRLATFLKRRHARSSTKKVRIGTLTTITNCESGSCQVLRTNIRI